jgi:histidine kinase
VRVPVPTGSGQVPESCGPKVGGLGKIWTALSSSLGFKITIAVGLILIASYFVFVYLVVEVQKRFFLDQAVREAKTFSTAVLNATNHSMLKNDREATANIVRDLSMREPLSHIRIYDHEGVTKYADRKAKVGRKVDKKAEACFVCHAKDKPFSAVVTSKRTRIYRSPEGSRLLGMITPIYNKPECYNAACHVHPASKKVLGVIDVTIPLKQFDAHVRSTAGKIILLALATCILVMATIAVYISVRVSRPVARLLEKTRALARDESTDRIAVNAQDELGQLAQAFNMMSARIQRRTRELLRSRQEYRILFEQVPCFISVIDRNFRIVRQNTRMREYFRGTVGMRCYEVYKRRFSKCDTCLVEETFRDGKGYQREECGISVSGTEANYVSYTIPIRDDKGDVLYAMAIAIDIGERVRLKRELQISEDFQTNLIENSIHGIIAMDDKGRINLFNKAAEQLLGYRADEVIGDEDLQKYFPAKFVEMILAAVRGEKLTDPRLVAQEAIIPSQTGERIPVRFSGVILFDNEKMVGSVGFYQDLRTFKKLEREKADADRLAVVGQTVAGLAHGIKNVLQGLEGGVFVMETAIEDKDDQLLDRGWQMITRNIGRISELVHDLLTYSKARSPKYEKIDPNALAEEVCALFDLRAKEHSIDLVRDLDPDVESFFADQRGIYTALTNLVSNAIDAFDNVEADARREIVVRTRSAPEWAVVFQVADTGQGMDEETQRKIFSSFFSTKGSKGTGLGLLVTSKMVQEHGGEISFESEPGVGSTFSISLPAGEPVETEQPAGENGERAEAQSTNS